MYTDAPIRLCPLAGYQGTARCDCMAIGKDAPPFHGYDVDALHCTLRHVRGNYSIFVQGVIIVSILISSMVLSPFYFKSNLVPQFCASIFCSGFASKWNVTRLHYSPGHSGVHYDLGLWSTTRSFSCSFASLLRSNCSHVEVIRATADSHWSGREKRSVQANHHGSCSCQRPRKWRRPSDPFIASPWSPAPIRSRFHFCPGRRHGYDVEPLCSVWEYPMKIFTGDPQP